MSNRLNISSEPFPKKTTPTRDALYSKMAHLISRSDWDRLFAEDIEAIWKLKEQHDAVILAHNYQTPEIFHCVADIRGDSLELAQKAKNVSASTIIMAGVHFMAETVKLLNPEKTVLIPDPTAGCSLAESITGENVRQLKRLHPNTPVVTYVNSTAEVKAETDICCTSANAQKIIESLKTSKVIMIPDEYLAQNISNKTGVEVITWQGRCEVHEKFTADEIKLYRRSRPNLVVIAHPECSPAVVAEADYTGSTADMMNFIQAKKPAEVMLVTECSLSDNIAALSPETNFVRPCNLCPHMKKITLKNIRSALETHKTPVTIPDHLFAPARRAVERMLSVKS